MPRPRQEPKHDKCLFCDDPLPEGRRSDMKFCRVREHAIQPSFTGESADLLRQAVGAQAEASSPDAPDEYGESGPNFDWNFDWSNAYDITAILKDGGRPKSCKDAYHGRGRQTEKFAGIDSLVETGTAGAGLGESSARTAGLLAESNTPLTSASIELLPEPVIQALLIGPTPSIEAIRLTRRYSPDVYTQLMALYFPDMRPVGPPGEHPSAAVRRLVLAQYVRMRRLEVVRSEEANTPYQRHFRLARGPVADKVPKGVRRGRRGTGPTT